MILSVEKGTFEGQFLGAGSLAFFGVGLQPLHKLPRREYFKKAFFFSGTCVFFLTLIFTKLFLFSGCKIKALRAKTNTYIKTPVRGEEPVFVVTGRKEDVALAKREILSAADHFSQIRASRKSNINSTLAFGQLMANTPGQTTVQVRVPYRVVGLVVGPKGATIKRIQQQVCIFFFFGLLKKIV